MFYSAFKELLYDLGSLKNLGIPIVKKLFNMCIFMLSYANLILHVWLTVKYAGVVFPPKIQCRKTR
jgi:hypothetical protein